MIRNRPADPSVYWRPPESLSRSVLGRDGFKLSPLAPGVLLFDAILMKRVHFLPTARFSDGVGLLSGDSCYFVFVPHPSNTTIN